MASGRTITLNSGYKIPVLGLGTWQSEPNEVKEAVKTAIKCGYRHIDAASVYGNEAEVGVGWRASGIDREQLFITSKLWNTDHAPEDVENALEKTLKDLQTDYIDLYLIHWPVAFRSSRTTIQPIRDDGYIDVVDIPIADTWVAMEKLVTKGKVRSIGVSNFTKEKIEELLSIAIIPPSVNQIEAHPYLQQQELLDWSKTKNIVVAAYSPLGNNIYNLPRAVDDVVVINVAKELGKTPAQVLISWAIQRHTVVLPKSVTAERIESNLQDFQLSSTTFDRIQGLERHQRMNFPARLGVDIFGEKGEESVKASAAEWVEQQRKLRE